MKIDIIRSVKIVNNTSLKIVNNTIGENCQMRSSLGWVKIIIKFAIPITGHDDAGFISWEPY